MHNGDATNYQDIKVIDDYTISFTFKEADCNNILELWYGNNAKTYYGFEKGDIETLKAKMLEPLGSGGYKFVNLNQNNM